MIGVFDSGFGGLVVLREFLQVLPQYDYLYLGDNARIPYGTRSDRVVYRFTEQAVDYLFRQGCQLIIVACHTASAKALRTIQQVYLPAHYPERRVLGVVIPTVEEALSRSRRRCVGVIATEGTVASCSFELELRKLDPGVRVVQQACPLLVPLIESGEQEWEGTDMILRRYLLPLKDAGVDTLILGCTHYSILKDKIAAIMGDGITLVCSGHPPVSHHRPHPPLPDAGQPVHGPDGGFPGSGTLGFLQVG